MQPLLQHAARVDKLRAVTNPTEQSLNELRLCGPTGALAQQPHQRRAVTIVRLEPSRASRLRQHELAAAYLAWREHAARRLVRQTGPLGRLTRRPEEFYDQLDRETLKTCRRCHQTIYPPVPNTGGYGSRPRPECHYCRHNYGTDSYRPTSKESEAHQ
jgi:hypothetical protein